MLLPSRSLSRPRPLGARAGADLEALPVFLIRGTQRETGRLERRSDLAASVARSQSGTAPREPIEEVGNSGRKPMISEYSHKREEGL